MNHKQNLHTHSTFSDGKDTPEELIIEALKRGFCGIGFSEHVFCARSSYALQMPVERTTAYQTEIRRLKEKYRGQIDVFCGMEYEMLAQTKAEGFDYLIGSAHYLDIDGRTVSVDTNLQQTLDCIRDNFGGDGMAYAKAYYENVSQLPQKGNFDILGHFDLVTKNNEKGSFVDAASKKYLDYAFDAIHALKGKIPLFEVNTGVISRGYRSFPYPQLDILREFKACGFGAVISSDCHNKDLLDHSFAEAEQLLLEAGFCSKYILTDKGFQEVRL